MDRQRAGELLDQVFNSGYSHENYEEFITHLLNEVTINRVNQNSNISIRFKFDDFVTDFDYFGVFRDSTGKKADILSIKLARDNSKIRARVKQRNIIAKWLKKTGSNCALVAFYDDTNDWRFSFVELEYKTVRLDDGRVRDLEELSPARRLSFLVGKNEPNHTCKKYLLDFILEDSQLPGLDAIRSAFGIESVSKEFFEKYRELYEKLLASLNVVVSEDELIKLEFKNKYITPGEFSKKLLGQIVFIYFLQKKGWLGVPKTGKWGSGRKDFLRAVFDGEFGSYDNFFNDVLEPLFYNAFANSERDKDYYDKFDCRIPFLNGGLFEPIGGYDWVGTNIVIDNSIFGEIFNTFDEFNFTIKEDEPLEKEVAVDPEMLGKIFENLLDDNLRKGYGAYYTPREIVHYMCQESLVNYLDDSSTVDRSVIDALVRQGNEIIDLANFRVPLLKHAQELDKLLRDIRIVDPAVGSGAFPVGMLSEIVNARLVLGELKNGEHLTPYNLKREAIENSLYGVDIDAGAVDIAKLRFWLSLVIDEENEDHIDPLPNLEQKIMCGDSLLESFHGVKLFDNSLIEKNGAVKTRIDEIDGQIKHLYEELSETEFGADTKDLQNEIDKLKKDRKRLRIEHKTSGDQETILVGGNFGASEPTVRLRELKRLRHEFFNETIKSKKEKLREKINYLGWMFIEDTMRAEGHGDEAVEEIRILRKKRSKPFFLWRLQFNEVFSEKGGFDIVIGNPPYVQIEGLQDEYKVALENEDYETFARRGDLYCLFYERGYGISRDGGQTALITSNSWIRTQYGKNLRILVKTKAKPTMLIDFNNNQIFETAIVNTNILIFSKTIPESDYQMPYAIGKGDIKGANFSEYVEQNKSHIELDELKDLGWTLVDKEIQGFMRKIENIGTPLKDWNIDINYGIKTGFNEAFIIDKDAKTELIHKDPKNAEIIKPIIRGRDIQKFSYKFANKWIILSKYRGHDVIKSEYPSIYEHLKEYENRLSTRGQVRNGQHHWLELDNNPTSEYLNKFEKEKIIWIELVDNGRFAYDNKGMYCEATTFVMTGESIKYLVALLNSKVINFYFSLICSTSGMGTNRWKKVYIRELPIPKIPEENQSPFIELVDIIMKKKEEGEDTAFEEAGINRLVYELYGLTNEEIAIVEK